MYQGSPRPPPRPPPAPFCAVAAAARSPALGRGGEGRGWHGGLAETICHSLLKGPPGSGPSSPSYEQAFRSSTAAWPAAPRAGHPAGSKAVRGRGGHARQEPAGHVRGVHTALFVKRLHAAGSSTRALQRHGGKRGGYRRGALQPPRGAGGSLAAQ